MKKNIHIFSTVLSVLLIVGLIGRDPLGLFAETEINDEGSLSEIQQRLNEAVDKASGATTRSMQLEDRLKAFDAKVREAKRQVAEMQDQKDDVRRQIAATKELIYALQNQLLALKDSQEYSAAELEGHKNELSAFVRYVSLQDVVVAETGPVVGGEVLHRLLRGSLGDLVDAELHRSAIIRARGDLLDRLSIAEKEYKEAQERLQVAALELSDELSALEVMYHNLDEEIGAGLAELEEQQHTRELTEEELVLVRQARAEEQAQIAAMQREMAQIQVRVKNFRLEEIEKKLREATQKKASIEREVTDLQKQATTLQKLADDVANANEAMQSAKGSDRKLYQRVEELKFQLTKKTERMTQLEELLSGTGSDNLRAYAIEKKEVEREIPALADKISLLQEGYPEDVTDAYIAARNKSRDAKAQIQTIDQKLSGLQSTLSELDVHIAHVKEEQEKVRSIEIDTTALYGFRWPVKGRITAGFHDPKYYQIYKVEHNAVDIAVPQGSPVYATTDGVVFTAKDAGLGYSYVLIGHDNGYASLYGHLSSIFVQKGQFVTQGQVIGLSGGKPGTAGAGWRTSGPHLHFEVILNGQRINPLNVLP